jgi:hypothetical protein
LGNNWPVTLRITLAFAAMIGAGVLITWLVTRDSSTAPPVQTIALTTHAPTPASTLVPDVVGQRLPAAVAAISAVGLRLSYVSYPVTVRSRAGTIVRQRPTPGMRARRNDQVVVYLAVAKKG